MYGSHSSSSGQDTVDRTQRRASRDIQRRTGRTFHLATRLLSSEYRDPTYVLYAFFRIADEVVDTADGPDEDVQRAELERLWAAALGERAVDDPVLEAFNELRTACDIPEQEIEIFLDAMERDVSRTRYETHEELETYVRGSAVAVAYMMLEVMAPDDPGAARPHAKALGEAFQLTNFLRDVKEDVDDFGRIYLPQRLLRSHGVTDAQIANGTVSEGFAAAMRAELERTERRYREGVAGIKYLPEGCQFAVLLAAVLYAEHHRLIRERDYDVLSERPELETTTRLGLLARTWWHWRRERDPEAVFYTVGAVPESPDSSSSTDVVDDTRRSVGTTRRLVRQLPAWIAKVADR